MNTKTMRLPPRRVLTPTKRKERDDFDAPPTPAKLLKPAASQSQAGSDKAAAPAEPDSSNQLLAGYLAHEYLTTGTLFGQPFDPARPQPVPPVDSRKVTKPGKREEAEPNKGAEPSKGGEKYQSYKWQNLIGYHFLHLRSNLRMGNFVFNLKGRKRRRRKEAAN